MFLGKGRQHRVGTTSTARIQGEERSGLDPENAKRRAHFYQMVWATYQGMEIARPSGRLWVGLKPSSSRAREKSACEWRMSPERKSR